MKKYLIYKISIILFIFYFPIFIASYIIFFQSFKEIYFLTIEKQHKELIYKIFNKINQRIDRENFDIQNEIKKIDEYTGIRVTLIKINGDVIYDSRENPKKMENHRNRPEIVSALEKGEGKSIRLSPTLNRYMFYYAVFFKERNIVIRTSLELDYIKRFFSFFKTRFLSLFSIIYLISLPFFLIFLSFSIKEISVIENFIKNLSTGRSGMKLLSLKQKKLVEIVNDLNIISEKLSLHSEFKMNKNIMSEIIEMIEEPVAFINLEGKIVAYNSYFKKFLKSTAEDKYYWEVIEKFEINEMVEKTVNSKSGFEKEIEIGEKSYFIKTKYLESLKIVLLFLFDITGFKEIEKVKKDFLTNITHELKTPLTIIKGYIETMEEEVENSEFRNYVLIIKNQIERLIKIVENVITLSSIEFKKIEIENFDICEVIKNVFELYRKKVEEKNIQLLLNSSNVQFIKGDKFKLEQVIINLIDNAVKFTDKGKIEISLYKKEKYIVIEVADTGIGISKQDLPRIFDKFYIGKKTPKTGTGLGLSIVKNIIELHNGKIEVESELGKGTKFIIYLPT